MGQGNLGELVMNPEDIDYLLSGTDIPTEILDDLAKSLKLNEDTGVSVCAACKEVAAIFPVEALTDIQWTDYFHVDEMEHVKNKRHKTNVLLRNLANGT